MLPRPRNSGPSEQEGGGNGTGSISGNEEGTTELRRTETNPQIPHRRPAPLVYVSVHVQTLDYIPSLVLVMFPAPSAQLHQLMTDNNIPDFRSFLYRRLSLHQDCSWE